MHHHTWRRLATRTLALVAAGAALYACRGDRAGEGSEAGGEAASTGADSIAFRNAVTPPDAGWTGPVFQLSASYPSAQPGECTTECPWLGMAFDSTSTDWSVWAPYLDSVLQYVIQGQTQELADATGWSTQVNGATRWFHVPWMAYDTVYGREFIHGTTNERTAHLSDLRVTAADGAVRQVRRVRLGVNALPGATGADTLFETWAVGMYNEYGAWALGQAVPQNGVPVAVAAGQDNFAMPQRFPQGTVVVKLLFTTATPQDVWYLAGSPEWTVDRHQFIAPDSFNTALSARTPAPVRLVQMDVAVRDDRSPIGWVYGTYAYNVARGGSIIPGWWNRMSPVGVQWGSDPGTWPAVDTASTRPISQTSLNRAILIREHDGCNGRLAGPVDNPKSACTACHGGATAPAPVGTVSVSGQNTVPLFGFADECTQFSPANAAYFANVSFPNPLPPFPGVSGATINLDTSLQLTVAYEQYALWNAAQSSR